MNTIRELFDPSKPIDRRIEKVIQYETSEESLLKQEITEYIATEGIEESFRKLLDQIDEGMSTQTEHEIGIWVSGFYGSGKSSFTKYLGLALDPQIALEGRAFREWLKDQFQSTTLKQRLETVAKRHPMTVILLDLSTEALAGTSMAPVSTVLYYKVLQWAGYSRDPKAAELEFIVDRDGKQQEFEREVEKETSGRRWQDVKNQKTIVATRIKKIASKLYPDIWPTPEDFSSMSIGFIETEKERVERILDIIERKTGNKNVLFVIDEVGQYVAPNDDRITNLQGLAQNLKSVGLGSAWIIATAQQTLTADDSRAAINTPKLYKLKDRFPIDVDLEASDIREICYRRLLAKSSAGKDTLEKLFDQYGQQLRHYTNIEAGKSYKSDLDKKSFIDLYPFLSQHFGILLKALGRLARSTGGIGLRSAIKVIQDILVGKEGARSPFADSAIGSLATTPVIYDALRTDIQKSDFRYLVDAVDRTVEAFGQDSIHAKIAKTVALMQILEDFPITRENTSALIHDRVDNQSQQEEVSNAVEELIREGGIPLNEVHGRLQFMSEAVNELERKKRSYFPGAADEKLIITSSLQAVFDPQPTATIYNTKSVRCGLKTVFQGFEVPVFGDREEVQLLANMVPDSSFEDERKTCTNESTQQSNKNTIYLIAEWKAELGDLITEIFRSEKIANSTRGQTLDKDKENYVTAQRQRADQLRNELSNKIQATLHKGVLIFQGGEEAVEVLHSQFIPAIREKLRSAGEIIYHKYEHAPVQADSGTAERFLKTKDLASLSSQSDPLGLVKTGANKPSITKDHPALQDIREYLDFNGQVEGKRLLDDFARSPCGWSKDTTRYLVGALLTAGDIKLRVGGNDVQVRGDQSVNALKTIPNFNKIGIALRDNRPSPDLVLRAAERLQELLGEDISPLEENVSAAVREHFSSLKTKYAPLQHKLSTLGVPGSERAESLQERIESLLSGDASDAVQRIGNPDSSFYHDIMWAEEIHQALTNDVEGTVFKAKKLTESIPNLQETELFENLKSDTSEQRDRIEDLLSQEDFYRNVTELQQAISNIEQKTEAFADELSEQVKESIRLNQQELEGMREWRLIGEEVQEHFLNLLDGIEIEASRDIGGIRNLLEKQGYIAGLVQRIKKEIRNIAEEIPPPDNEVSISVKPVISSEQELDRFVGEARTVLQNGKIVRITVTGA